ncbi:MAG TPA: ABC transporter permease [Bryobacteraceae bacterium]|nr:ABC transporter permease [Bryobacteraceae bacterium]
MRDVWLDVRFAARIFSKRPGFTAIAALTLALGIGATTAVFSIVHAVLLRPLPYKDPSRQAAIWVTSTREKELAKLFATYADYVTFRRDSRTLESVSAATWATRMDRVLMGFGPAREVMAVPATGSFFETLGVNAEMGRTFRTADEGHGCFLVATHKFWATTLGGDRAAIGKPVTLDRKPCTLLGVMPERFGFYPTQTQLWILLGPDYQPDQNGMLVGIFARLRPGVTPARAQSELRSLYRPQHMSGGTRDFAPVVYDLHGEFTFLAGRTLRTTLLLVFGAVVFVLLIACVNVANLLLARLAERRRELAVRAAIGSGQGRLVRQLLTEGLLLAGIGAALGIGLAEAVVRYFRVLNPIELSVGADVQVNAAVLGFSIALSAITTLMFGLLPAVRGSRVDLVQNLKAAGRGTIEGSHRLAKGLIAVEMALSFLLLVAAGLFITSALRMGSEPLGFNPGRLMAAHVPLPAFRYASDAQRLRAWDELLERLGSMPGQAGAALSSKLPPYGGGDQILEIRGRRGESKIHDTGADAVSPAFFDVLQIPVLRGRVFDGHDRENAPPVAIINEALSRKYFAQTDPVGQEIRLAGDSMPWLTIVGVAGNLKHTELMNEMTWSETPVLYRPLAQEPRQSVQAVVRAAGDTGALSRQIRRQIAVLDPAIPINDVEPVSARLAKVLAYPRFRALVLALFALGALMLSAVGLNGVLAQLVAQRTAEFGLRRAIGAQTHDLLWLTAVQGGGPVLAGLAAGLGLAVAFSRIVASLLYGIRGTDAQTLAVVSLALVAVAGVAIWAPARRAVRVDPMAALREE